jgi:hypothetical protein
LGGPSKELWIVLIVAIPVTLFTFAMAIQFGGGDMTLPAIQAAVLVLGSIGLWRLGGRIIEGITRIYTDATRIFGAEPRTSEVEQTPRDLGNLQERAMPSPLSDSQVFCVHCGYPIPVYAAFCRRCGKKQ